MSILADHIGALILDVARQRGGRFNYFIDDAAQALQTFYNLQVPHSLIAVASERLSTLSGQGKLSSPLTGDLYRVSVDSVTRWFDEDSEPNQNTSPSYDRSWDLRQTEYPTFKTYYYGGEPWVQRLVASLSERNLLADESEQDIRDEAMVAPASDRIVRLDHNSAEYKQVDNQLEELSELVRKDNSEVISQPADRPRFLEHIASAQRLLKLERVSTRAIGALLLPMLTYLSVKFADEAIGSLASALIEALKGLMGISF